MQPAESIKYPDFHYFMGVNCYQNTKGYRTPLIIINFNGGRLTIAYVSLVPGLYSRGKTDIKNSLYRKAIIDGCLADGAIDIGRHISFKDGYKTAAVSFARRYNDFQFIGIGQDGSGETKVPIKYADRTKDYRELIGGHQFDRFVQLPEGMLPPYVEQLNPTLLDLGISDVAEHSCLKIDYHPRLHTIGEIDALDRLVVSNGKKLPLRPEAYPVLDRLTMAIARTIDPEFVCQL